LLFISGIFIPLREMAPLARVIAYLSPLTYAQDVMNQAVLGCGLIDPWLDLAMLLLSGVLFLWPSLRLHHRARVLGRYRRDARERIPPLPPRRTAIISAKIETAISSGVGPPRWTKPSLNCLVVVSYPGKRKGP